MHLRTLSGLLFLFSSCTNLFYIENTSECSIAIDELKPAEIKIDPIVNKIAIVLPLQFDSTALEVIIDEEVVSDFTPYIPDMITVAANAMAEELALSPRYQVIPCMDTFPTIDVNDNLWSSTAQLAEKLNADALLIPNFSHGSMIIKFVSSVVWDDENLENDLSQKYLAHSKIELAFRWNLIIPELQKVISKEIIYKNKYQSNWEWDKRNAFSDLTDPYDILDFACINISHKVAGYIAPLWQKSTRSIYDKGHPLMKEAATEAITGNWDYAIALWDSLSTRSQPGISTHAQYNLAVAMEIMGNYEESIRLAQSLWRSHKMSKAKDYIPVLTKRMEEQSLIENQMQGIWFEK